MEFNCIGVPFEVKFLEEEGKSAGTFEGYGAVFGNMDSHGDVIEPGAFAASLLKSQREGRGLPPMYKMHGMAMGMEPVGIWDHMSEDTNGLQVKGRLIGLDTEQGKWTYSQVKEGALKGLSIGYNVPPHGSKAGSGKAGEPRRFLKTINLREVSLVDSPSNAFAQVNAIKSRFGKVLTAAECETKRDLEEILRDVGFSNTQAKAIASRGWNPNADPRDEDATMNVAKAALEELARKFTSR